MNFLDLQPWKSMLDAKEVEMWKKQAMPNEIEQASELCCGLDNFLHSFWWLGLDSHQIAATEESGVRTACVISIYQVSHCLKYVTYIIPFNTGNFPGM